MTTYTLRAKAVFRRIFPLRKLLFFNLSCYPVEIAYLCSPNRGLSNGVWLEYLFQNKNVDASGSPYYSDHVRSSRNVIFLNFRMLLFFSLTSYLAEIAYFNLPNRELSNGVGVMELY